MIPIKNIKWAWIVFFGALGKFIDWFGEFSMNVFILGFNLALMYWYGLRYFYDGEEWQYTIIPMVFHFLLIFLWLLGRYHHKKQMEVLNKRHTELLQKMEADLKKHWPEEWEKAKKKFKKGKESDDGK